MTRSKYAMRHSVRPRGRLIVNTHQFRVLNATLAELLFAIHHSPDRVHRRGRMLSELRNNFMRPETPMRDVQTHRCPMDAHRAIHGSKWLRLVHDALPRLEWHASALANRMNLRLHMNCAGPSGIRWIAHEMRWRMAHIVRHCNTHDSLRPGCQRRGERRKPTVSF